MTQDSQYFRRTKTFLEAVYRLYEHSGFSLAGAVAFSFIVSLFPFCIFLGAPCSRSCPSASPRGSRLR
jgi:uncharacterized BrkB/YihY/UPF0761 family membrane protein